MIAKIKAFTTTLSEMCMTGCETSNEISSYAGLPHTHNHAKKKHLPNDTAES